MIKAARAVYFTALGLWVGGMATLALVVAPTLFRNAPSRAIAGTLFGAVLRGFGPVQIALGILAIGGLSVLWAASGVSRRGAGLGLGALVLMLALALNAQFVLGPAIERERSQIVGFDALPPGVPARARFDSLHRTSVALASATLLLGTALLAGSAAAWTSRDGT